MVESFVGVAILTALIGLVHQAWFGIIWTLIYELFPGEDALPASGFFFCAAGIVAFVVPSGLSAILGSLEESEETDSDFLTSYITTSSPFTDLDTPVATAGRSLGNQMVLVFVSVLMGISILLQCCMFLAIRKEKGTKIKVCGSDEATTQG